MLSVSRYISCTTSQNSNFNCKISIFSCATVRTDQIWLKISLRHRKLKIKKQAQIFQQGQFAWLSEFNERMEAQG